MLVRWWQNPANIRLFFFILFFHFFAICNIIYWWFKPNWFISDTKCMVNLDFRNKTWRPCTLTIGLQERCIYMNGTRVYCDDWDEMGVTIHLISIPMQTDILPGKATADWGELSMALIFGCAIMGFVFCFTQFWFFTATANLIMETLLIICCGSIYKTVTEAKIDHRPEVQYGSSCLFYGISFGCSVVGSLIQIIYAIIKVRKVLCIEERKVDAYSAVATEEGNGAEEVEMPSIR